MEDRDDGVDGSEDMSSDLANELEADLEKELAQESGETANNEPMTPDDQRGEVQASTAGEAAEVVQPTVEPQDLAAVLGLGRNKEDLEALARAEQNRKNAVKLGLLNDSQLKQFEAFRRSKLDRKTVGKLMQSVTQQPPNPHSVIVVCGVAKMFVGDLIETARAITGKEEEVGPLRPSHIHQAYQVLKRRTRMSALPKAKRVRLH